MGCFSSSASSSDSTYALPTKVPPPVVIRDQIRVELSDFDSYDVKLLIFGYDGCGIRTLFKQIRNLYGTGFTQSDRGLYQKLIRISLIKDMQALVEAAKLHGNLYGTTVDSIHDAVMGLTYDDDEFSKDLVDSFLELWNNPATRLLFDELCGARLSPNSEYFIEALQTVVSNNYIPSDLDILMARTKQLPPARVALTFDGLRVEVDYLGKKHDAAAFSKCLQGMDYLLVVLSLGDFDAEVEGMGFVQLFSSVSESALFAERPVLVVLNKLDVFARKLAAHPARFSAVFPDYAGSCSDVSACVSHVAGAIAGVRRDRRDTIEVMTATAVDADSVRALLQSVGRRLRRDRSGGAAQPPAQEAH